jgi:hypothetical protein
MNEAGAVLITGLLAVAAAVWGVISQRTIARTRATVEHIRANENDKDIIESRRAFIRLAKADGGLAPWAEEAKEREESTDHIRIVMNEYELISIALQRGIFDKVLYRRWFKSGIVRYWGYGRPFAERVRERTGNSLLWHEFEELAKMMEKPPPKRWWGWSR